MNALRFSLTVLLLATPPILVGCRSDAPDIVAVEGIVTHNGQPVPNIRVYFQPTDGRQSWGDTNAEGKFKLDYDEEYDGAKVGTHRVHVADPGSFDSMATPPAGGKHKDLKEILAKYGSLNSKKTVEISKAVYDLKLELD